ncbi:M23 family metallopeptidase [Blastococcus sp. SYSU DS0828]
MSSLHHDRLPEGGAVPAGTVDATLAPARSTSGTIEEKAASTVPPQRQGKARKAGAGWTTDPTARRRARAATVKVAGATAATAAAATRKATTAARAAAAARKTAKARGPETPAPGASGPQAGTVDRASTLVADGSTTAEAQGVQAIAATAAAETPVRRRPTPYKRSAVDLAALAPVTDVAALTDAPVVAPDAVVVVKDAPAQPERSALAPVPAEPVVRVVGTPGADAAEVLAAVATGGRRWLDRRPPAVRRRPALYLAAVLVGALGLSGASVAGPTEVATETVSQSVSVAEQLGIDGSAAAPRVDEDDTSRLREVVASRSARETERTAAANAQAEADRIAQEEADRAAAEAARPAAVLPVEGGRLTSGFGARWGTLHAGIDLAAPMRTPEYAVMDGVVLEAGPAGGYGLVVYIQHGNGDVTVYGHMDEILVTPGQVVRAGDTIALLGNRGQSTGPHLHFEVHVGGIGGEPIDPLPWLRERGVQI